jgi:hypothetical protein
MSLQPANSKLTRRYTRHYAAPRNSVQLWQHHSLIPILTTLLFRMCNSLQRGLRDERSKYAKNYNGN